ncbi:hypothetical protein SDJN02_07583, partial [Cucurbita argyrosperma subsp. argyrosperma]
MEFSSFIPNPPPPFGFSLQCCEVNLIIALQQRQQLLLLQIITFVLSSINFPAILRLSAMKTPLFFTLELSHVSFSIQSWRGSISCRVLLLSFPADVYGI